jgi:hypothetical protein
MNHDRHLLFVRSYYLLLAIFRAGNEIDSFHMPNIDLISQDIGENNLRDVSEGERYT